MATRPKVFVSNQHEFNNVGAVTVDTLEIAKPSDTFRDEFPIMAEVDITNITELSETVTLKVPQSVYDEYLKTAKMSDLTVEELMQHRLTNCKNHNAVRGVWFSDSERAQLENIIQKWPIESASQVLKLLVKTGTVKIDGEEIVLTPAQKRVLHLAMYGGRTPKTFFESMIKKELRV